MRHVTITLVALAVSLPQMCALAPPAPRVVIHPIPITKQQEIQPSFCVDCHADKNAKVVHGVMKKGNCVSCHKFTVIGDDTQVTLIATGRELCLQCHKEKDTSNARGVVHKPELENCTRCHNPHASDYPNELVKPMAGAKGANLCLDCHDEGTKPIENGSRHEALDKGCNSCHVTHKIGERGKREFDFHLAKASPAICIDCHKPADPKVQAAHGGQPFSASDCSSCHASHDSPIPKLIFASRHKPFAERKCGDCHAEPKDGEVALKGTGTAFCYACHEDKQKQIESAKWKHSQPYVKVTCNDCHESHASARAALMKGDEGQICAKCHERSALPVKHGPYEFGKCTSCHNPHGSDEPKLLWTSADSVCRGCHILNQAGVKVSETQVELPWKYKMQSADYQNSPKLGLDPSGDRGHPVVHHPFSGKNTKSAGGGQLTCLTCHQAHAARTKHLLPSNVSDSIQLCEVCHKVG